MRLTEQCSFQSELLMCFGGKPGAPLLCSGTSLTSVWESGGQRHWGPRKITHQLLKGNVCHLYVQPMIYLIYDISMKTKMSFTLLEHKVWRKQHTSYFIEHGFYFLSNHKLRTKNTEHRFFFFLSVEVKLKGVFEGKFSLLFTGNQTLVILNGCSMPNSSTPGGENFP